MKVLVNDICLRQSKDGAPLIVFVPQGNQYALIQAVADLKAVLAKGKLLMADIEQFRQKRSPDANSYAWVLITKIAEELSKDHGHIYTKEEVYIEMLKQYGQREPQLVSVVAEGAGIIYRATDNHCVEVGEYEVGGKIYKQFAILKGSSGYDTRQMAVLIDGIVQEAQELGIETKTPEELAKIKQEWGK